MVEVEMNPALLALVGVVIAAALTALGAILAQQAKRITDLELATLKAQSYNRKLWMYCRGLIDLYYKHRRADAPPPPDLPAED